MWTCQCCQCTRGGHAKQDKQQQHYSVRSVALRGDNDETLEVCIAAAEEVEAELEAAEAACSACPPACSDPHCAACGQKCPHGPEPWHGQQPHYAVTKRSVHLVKHPKFRTQQSAGYQG